MSADSQPPSHPQMPAAPGAVGSTPDVNGPLPPIVPLAPPVQSRREPPIAPPIVAGTMRAEASPPPSPTAVPRYVAQAVSAAPPLHATSSAGAPRIGGGHDPFRGRRKFVVSALVSSVVHFLLVVWLALLTFEHPISTHVELQSGLETMVPTKFDTLNTDAAAKPTSVALSIKTQSAQSLAASLVPDPAKGRQGGDPNTRVPRVLVTPGNLGTGELLTPVGGSPFGMLDGREGEMKSALLGDGASEGSEQAVARGLRWLAAHQRDDGSWHFNHLQDGVCKYCRNPGNHGSTTAATGLALLPFLGANQTHLRGEYQDTVRRGLEFLKKRMIATPLGGDLQDGVNLYSQAIATLALCESYALTRDPELQYTCREAIRFIVNSQDKNGGGWRYFPGQVGDTTVTGWMLMALKSGQLTYMPTSPDVWTGAKRYLDGVQDDDGAAYGYQSPSTQEPTMTAIGLLCRMYGGWPRNEPALARGVRSLSKRGPSDHDLYYDYYATQVLRHYGGPEWIAWNLEMREFLIRTQSQEGHSSGSWYFPDKHGDQGGRIYNTAMSILILEVYYRYLPIYGFRATGTDYRDR